MLKLFKKKRKVKDTKLIKSIAYIKPYPQKKYDNAPQIRRRAFSAAKKGQAIFLDIKGLNVKEREFYNSL